MASVEDGRLSTLAEPLPLPPYQFDPTLSEDENFLTWVSILARHSSSKKGHMGTIFVRPPTIGNPADGHPCTDCQPPVGDRIVHHANNFPLLYSRIAKTVPEVHAEALVIARCARRGIALDGCTVYISYPPCIDCMKLLLSAGVRRCVFKKAILNNSAQGEASLVAAEAEGLELVGTLDSVIQGQSKGMDQQALKVARNEERKQDEARDQRVRAFWAGVGEDAQRTRDRVARWWESYTSRYRAAEDVIRSRYGNSGMEEEEKRRMAEKERRRAAKRAGKMKNRPNGHEQFIETNGEEDSGTDELVNEDRTLKRPSVEVDDGPAAKAFRAGGQ